MGDGEILLRSDQIVADGVDGRFTAGHDIELEEDAADMLGGGAGTDEERVGDLPVGFAVYQQTQHIQLTRRQNGAAVSLAAAYGPRLQCG
jgi:hypothetical protein